MIEQVFVLREEGLRFGPHRSYALIQFARTKSKPPSLQKPKTGAPDQTHDKSLATLPTPA